MFAKETMLAMKKILSNDGQDTLAEYAALLTTKASLESSLTAINGQEEQLLAQIIESLCQAPLTKETASILKALTARLAALQGPHTPEKPPAGFPKRKVLRIALTAALLILAFIPYGLFAFAGDIRQAVMNTIRGGVSTTYTINTGGNLSLSGLYAPSRIPSGYALVAKSASNRANVSILTYENDVGKQAKYYLYHASGEAATIDNEQGEVTTVQVAGADALFSRGQDGINMISGLCGEGSSYRIEGELPVDELIDMAASIAMQ